MTRTPRSGVALLEVMIALLIMAMSALAIAAALGTLGRTGALLSRQDTRVSEAIAAGRLQTWAEAIPPGLIPESEPLLTGTNTSLTFFTVEPAREEPLKVTLRLEGTTLIARSDTQTLTLSTDATALNIRSFGQVTRAEPPRWLDRWDRPGLPRLVKVGWRDGAGVAQVPVVLDIAATANNGRRNLRSLVPGPFRP